MAMAARLLTRSKTLSIARLFRHSSLVGTAIPSSSSSSPCLRVLYYLASPPLLRPLHDSRSAVPMLDSAGALPHDAVVGSRRLLQTTCNGKEGECSKVIAFSPLEGNHVKERKSGLGNESSKIKRMELSQKITYTLIPAVLLMSKSTATTSLLIFLIYWQIYGFFKEIFLDYVHQEVTRKWVLIYFKLLLLILAKDTILDFDLV